MDLHALQHAFMNTLLGEETGFSEQVVEHGSLSRDQRVGIYTYAYKARLRETIENDHEILGLYLGDALFDEMVDGYIHDHPSTYRSLRYFSSALPDYLKNTAPFSAHPLLSELARFERCLLFAFDAPEAVRANFETLQQLPPNQWPAMTLSFHPSCQIFETQWNCVESWQALKQNTTPPSPNTHSAIPWLVWRNADNLTEFKSLTPAEIIILNLALNGECFATICESLCEFIPEDQVGEASVSILSAWIEQGIISQILTP
jgi:hypothetical protein